MKETRDQPFFILGDVRHGICSRCNLQLQDIHYYTGALIKTVIKALELIVTAVLDKEMIY